ncbi:methyl-CpG-binding domain-containing protein 2-like isoform X2 [Primulina huaijiensis]|uniref:methyl-CpG-binding domain-containing protein 2-like isoform X1 n=1 Tax=Primulina huaijiensis TaxID=1492673 RepID=UPI003CC788CE
MEQSPSASAKKVWESVHAYAVQCTSCLKWRLSPSKEKYEEIRETIEEHPFTCDIARQWKPEISCATESDVKPLDQNWIWAMDKPNIPRTPKGWQRIIRARSGGGTKFADVYYVAPSNKRLRSMVELDRYLGVHPQFEQEGVTISQFSFKSPAPFEDKNVAKRRPRSSSRDISGTESAVERAAPEPVVDSQAESSANPMLAMVPYVNKD